MPHQECPCPRGRARARGRLVERLRTLHKDRATLIRAVGAAQDAGDKTGVELTRSDLGPIIRAALSAAIGGER